MERTVLDEQCCDRAAPLVEACFDDDTLCCAVGIGLQFLHLCHKQDGLQQLIDILVRLGGNRDADRISAPLLGDELILCQLLHHALRVCAGAIHLIDCNDDRNICRLRMVDGFHRLRHDAVVRRDDEDGDIRRLCAARAHRSEGRMAGGIQKGDVLPVDGNAVRADMLRDAARFSLRYGGMADRVEQGGLAVVDVAHDHHNRIAWQKVLIVIRTVVDDAVLDGHDDFLFHLHAQLGGYDLSRIIINDLVDRGHHAEGHQLFDNLRGSTLHHSGEVTHGNFIRHLDDKLRLFGALRGDPLEALRLRLPARRAHALAAVLLWTLWSPAPRVLVGAIFS